MNIEAYTEIDQKEKFDEYFNVKGKTIKNAYKGVDKRGYSRMEINFTDETTLIILEKEQTSYFDAWVEG